MSKQNGIEMHNSHILPYAGGLAIIASALKGTPVSISGSSQAGSRELIISFNWFLWTGISEGAEGKKPLFLTISTNQEKECWVNSDKKFALNDNYEWRLSLKLMKFEEISN